MRSEYSKLIKTYLMDREWYKLVDCLEDVSDFWSYGRDFTTMPTYNTYMPTRTHIMDKPDMMEPEKDDLGYQMNLNRVSPYSYLNTLKGYKMLPKPADRPALNPHKPKFYKKWRRLSQPKMQGFSTINTNAGTYQPKQTYLQSILNYSSIYRGI
jgi:hypothetical protein